MYLHYQKVEILKINKKEKYFQFLGSIFDILKNKKINYNIVNISCITTEAIINPIKEFGRLIDFIVQKCST